MRGILMKKKIIFTIPFNNRHTTPAAGEPGWIRWRLGIFMRYTLRSLMKQESQRFQAFVFIRPESEAFIRAELKQHPPLPDHVAFVTKAEYERRVAETVQGFDLLYEANLESDDMYHRSFVRLLENHVPKKLPVLLIPQYGYVYDSVQSRLARFFFWAPSFLTAVHPTEDWLAGRRIALPRGYVSALTAPREFIGIRRPLWINHVHSDNTGVSWNRMEVWKLKGYNDAFSIPPWNNASRKAAHFGPEITNKHMIPRILDEYC
ncbi:MAG: hypothetical protein A9Z00_08220 [Thermobacillus sp. ZCTH02-B1]|nr:MAG: hypothetical protein A9Z00_08220 [Thermobacillus sp. ZCTH02-B1]